MEIEMGSSPSPSQNAHTNPATTSNKADRRNAGDFTKESKTLFQPETELETKAGHIEDAVHHLHEGKPSHVNIPRTDAAHIPTHETAVNAKKEKSAFDFLLHAIEFIKSKFVGGHDKNKVMSVEDKIKIMPPAVQNLGLAPFVHCLTFKNVSLFKEPLTEEETQKVAELVQAYADNNLPKLEAMIPPKRAVGVEEVKATPLEESNARVMAAAFKEIVKHLNLFEKEDGKNALVEVSNKYDPKSMGRILKQLFRPKKTQAEVPKEVTKLAENLETKKGQVLQTVMRIIQRVTVDLSNTDKSDSEQLAEVFAPCFAHDEGETRNVQRITSETLENLQKINDPEIAIKNMPDDEAERRLNKLHDAYPEFKVDLHAYDEPDFFEKDVNDLVKQFASAVDFQPKKEQYSYEVYNAALEKIAEYRAGL